jgi:hypothetical protein
MVHLPGVVTRARHLVVELLEERGKAFAMHWDVTNWCTSVSDAFE